MPRFLQVFAIEKSAKFRKFQPNIRYDVDQSMHGCNRVLPLNILHLALFLADQSIRAAQDGREESFLTAEVVIEEVFVCLGDTRDSIYTGALISARRKLLG